jgi:hypothetical protein
MTKSREEWLDGDRGGAGTDLRFQVFFWKSVWRNVRGRLRALSPVLKIIFSAGSELQRVRGGFSRSAIQSEMGER